MKSEHLLDPAALLAEKGYTDRLFFRIREVSEILDVKPYVLRFWETEFDELKPEKSPTGQRVYLRKDVELASRIRNLLYVERYSIAGARLQLKDELREERKSAKKTVEPSEPADTLKGLRVQLCSDETRALHSALDELKKLSQIDVNEWFE